MSTSDKPQATIRQLAPDRAVIPTRNVCGQHAFTNLVAAISRRRSEFDRVDRRKKVGAHRPEVCQLQRKLGPSARSPL